MCRRTVSLSTAARTAAHRQAEPDYEAVKNSVLPLAAACKAPKGGEGALRQAAKPKPSHALRCDVSDRQFILRKAARAAAGGEHSNDESAVWKAQLIETARCTG